jgi:hypothetical protein
MADSLAKQIYPSMGSAWYVDARSDVAGLDVVCVGISSDFVVLGS